MTSGFSNSNNPNSTQDQQTPGQQQNQPSDLIAGPDTSSGLNPAIVGTPSPGTEGPNGGGVRIQADVANNSLVIFANTEMTQRIIKALERIDVPQLQVAINVTMAEVRLTDELRFGIQYYLKTHHGIAEPVQRAHDDHWPNGSGLQFRVRQRSEPGRHRRCLRRHHRRAGAVVALAGRGGERGCEIPGRRPDPDRHPHRDLDREHQQRVE